MHRSSGILLHVSSLPGGQGVGDLGPAAYHWIDQLAAAKQAWWQVLPLGPTGYADSPYQSFSSFAGNVNLLNPDLLLEDGLLRPDDFAGWSFPAAHVDYAAVLPFKRALLQRAWERLPQCPTPGLRSEFEAFCHREAGWLEDYVLFMALK